MIARAPDTHATGALSEVDTTPLLPEPNAVIVMANRVRSRRDLAVNMAVIAGAAALFAAPTSPLLKSWFWQYTQPDSYYGYALFVPVLVAIMIWYRCGTLRESPTVVCPAALLALVPSLLVFVLATKMYMQAVMSIAFLVAIISSIWFVVGTRVVRVIAFPLAFLFAMAPLPGPVLNDATIGLQKLSTSGAALLLRATGFATEQQGNILHLGNYAMEVDVPCSGFKLLLCLLTVSAAFAYLSGTTRIRQLALFVAALPLSIILNSVRIALIGMVGESIGASAAHAFHDWSGMMMLALCMIALFGLAKGLGCRKLAGLPLF